MKALKIIGIIAGALAAIAIVIAIFVPGLPFYLIFKDRFPASHISLSDFPGYDAQFTVETQTIENDVITADIPDYFTHRNSREEVLIIYVNDDEVIGVADYPPVEFNLVELLEDEAKNEKEAAKLFETVGLEVPETMFDFLYANHTFTWERFNIRSFSNAITFVAFATLKEVTASSFYDDEIYYYENEYFKGFVFTIRKDDEPDRYTADLFFTDDGNKSVVVVITAHDDETAWAFLNSIRPKVENHG
jgi:hypothetical protein